MSHPRVTITDAQLRDVELALAGAWDGAVTLTLPATDGAAIELVDVEGTGVAVLAVSAAVEVASGDHVHEVIGEGEAPQPAPRFRVSGTVAPARPLGHRDQAERRVTLRPHRASKAVLITGDVPAVGSPEWQDLPITTTVAVLDHGDSRELAAAVAGVAMAGHDAVVLPAPAEDGRSAEEWRIALLEAASALVAPQITLWETSRRPAPGQVILLTGLSGSGKSTIAKLLVQRLAEVDERTASLLDGDEVRLILSAGLGFSREDRVMNVSRIGWVAALVAKHGGIAVCAPIAPYAIMRDEMRARAEAVGRFLLVHIATPLEVCEQRDRKGLYAKARAGEIPQFTGISDPYEVPADADLVVDASAVEPDAAVELIIETLRRV